MDPTRIEYLNCIEKKVDNLPITKFKFHIKKASKRNFTNWPQRRLELTTLSLHKDLQAKFNWVTETSKKLKIAPPHQLTETKLPPAEKMRKGTKELIQHVFLNKEVIVDGMERNLVPPQSVTTRKLGEVIEHLKPGILFYNGNVELGGIRRIPFPCIRRIKLLYAKNEARIQNNTSYSTLMDMVYRSPNVRS
ncbi:hypothetical protein Tco_1209767 [Tanacetum coccineum]